jgi:protein-L-isoaspartate(D-aspartate) O-methyltransferase
VDEPFETYLEARRSELVDVLSHVVSDTRVLIAFRTVPRHLFVPANERWHAYDDRALALSEGQTVSQPSMIAIMLESLATEPHHRALEVGAGSGYAAALLSTLVREVHAVEIRPALLEAARVALERSGVRNVTLHEGDGSLGLPGEAPFDRILVSAAAREVPAALAAQLGPGGRIAIPVGDDRGQTLLIGARDGEGPIAWSDRTACLFVPLVSA